MPRDIPEYRPLYDEFVGHNNLTPEDIDLLIKVSGFDSAMVRRAIDLADDQPEIENYMGWLVSCIKAGGYTKTDVVEGSHDRAVYIKDLKEKANSPETKMRVWEMTKQKPDFADFLAYMESAKGITFDEIEICYDPGEAAREYIDWKKAGSPSVSN